MAKSAGNTFARGKGSVVAAGLDAPIATIRQFREQGIEGPWELVEDVLVSVDFALRTRDVGAFDELSKTARTVFEKMWIKAGVHSHDERVVADFVLDSAPHAEPRTSVSKRLRRLWARAASGLMFGSRCTAPRSFFRVSSRNFGSNTKRKTWCSFGRTHSRRRRMSSGMERRV